MLSTDRNVAAKIKYNLGTGPAKYAISVIMWYA